MYIDLEVPLVLLFLASVAGYFIYRFIKDGKEEQAFRSWVEKSGYTFIDLRINLGPISNFISLSPSTSIPQSSFMTGDIKRGFSGQLQQSHNAFSLYLQTETRGSGRSRKTYKRTIFQLDIPDTQLHMIVNSKINNDYASGGNLEAFSKEQRYSLEGDFGEFFDVLMPSTTQSETLTILAPNSMIYILKELADFDIEINGDKMFIYSYKHLRIAEIESVIPKIDALMKELWLRKEDKRPEKVTNALVARTATDPSITKRVLKRDIKFFGLFSLLVVFSSMFIKESFIFILIYGVLLFVIAKALYDWSKVRYLRLRYKSIIKNY